MCSCFCLYAIGPDDDDDDDVTLKPDLVRRCVMQVAANVAAIPSKVAWYVMSGTSSTLAKLFLCSLPGLGGVVPGISPSQQRGQLRQQCSRLWMRLLPEPSVQSPACHSPQQAGGGWAHDKQSKPTSSFPYTLLMTSEQGSDYFLRFP